MKFTLQVEQGDGIWQVGSEELEMLAYGETLNEALDAFKAEWVKARLASIGFGQSVASQSI